MATYKVLQDIEAEDKLLGPLTLKQFIFAIITLVFCFLAFIFYRINIILAIPWLVPILFFGFMAAPIGRDQPNDVWLAARIRFLVQPRKRIWNQSGLSQLVTITAPKKIERVLTNNLSQHEVKSRLNALASTLDSRGWAVKNVNVNLTSVGVATVNDESDRLISITALPQEVPTIETDVTAADDIMDPMSNMVAQRFDTRLKEEQQKHLQSLREQAQTGHITQATQGPAVDYSFITNPQVPTMVDPGYATFNSQVIAPHNDEITEASSFLDNKPTELSQEEKAVLEAIQKNKDDQPVHMHEKIVLPLAEQQRIARERLEAEKAKAAQAQQQHAPDAKIHELSTLPGVSVASVATLAQHAEEQAQKEATLNEGDSVSLH